jgi:lysophospholipase L1-like esterase
VLDNLLQYVPLNEYKENLKKIIAHEVWKGHDPKFILIVPPPICEYLTQEHDASMGRNYVQRLAARTKQYGDAALEAGTELGVPMVNLWKTFTDYAGGWKEGDVVPGCKELPKNPKMADLLRDGLHFNPKGCVVVI